MSETTLRPLQEGFEVSFEEGERDRWRFVCRGPGFVFTGNPNGHGRKSQAVAEFQAVRIAMAASLIKP